MTTLGAADVSAILAHWDVPAVMAVAPIEPGQPVIKINTAGPTFVLKDITDAPNRSRLEFTHAVLTHVARSGLRVPVPIRSRSAELAVHADGRDYLLFEYIRAGAPSDDPAQKGELLFQTGQAIARLHTALASYPDPDVTSQTWREDLAGQLPGWLAALRGELPEAQAAVVRDVAQARGEALAAALRGLPEQLIHRDCHPGNILVDGTHVVGFVDCDHLCLGTPVYDLATYAVHHLKWVTEDAAATELWLAQLPRLVQGYRAQRRLTAAETAALPAAMLAYHLLLSNWFLSTGQLDPIGMEIRALGWLHTHYQAVGQAVGLAPNPPYAST